MFHVPSTFQQVINKYKNKLNQQEKENEKQKHVITRDIIAIELRQL